ncbi:MAG TPA: hypothetical protein VFG45_07450 [Candidatus Nitrosocosmicus sp.]|nr:hypothetical protein [Candidatus Nitrosocosmicus sp.]
MIYEDFVFTIIIIIVFERIDRTGRPPSINAWESRPRETNKEMNINISGFVFLKHLHQSDTNCIRLNDKPG